MRELHADLPVVLKDDDLAETAARFHDWLIEPVQLGRGPMRRSGVIVPLGARARISLIQVRCATVLRGMSSASHFSLISSPPASPPVRSGARALGNGVCLLLAPRARIDLHLPKDCCALTLSVPAGDIVQAAAVCDSTGLPPLRYAELRSSDTNHTALLNKCMHLMEGIHHSIMPALVAPEALCRLHELIDTTIASLFARLQPLPPEPGTRTIRRRAVVSACSYIDANLRRPITLAELCAIADVRSRTLEYGFRDFYDIGPMAYLRCVRLCSVRRELLHDGRSNAAVASTARRWSFSHMGQFSRDYRLLFGESPSRTLARGRDRRKRKRAITC